MKRLHIIVALCIINNIFLHSMNIVQYKSHKIHAFKKTNSTTRHYSESKMLLNLNTLASISSIALATTTGDCSFVIPAIPHVLNNLCMLLYPIKPKSTQMKEDLKLLRERPSEIENYINNTPRTPQEREHLQNILDIREFSSLSSAQHRIKKTPQSEIYRIDNIRNRMLQEYQKIHRRTHTMMPASMIIFNIVYFAVIPMSAAADVTMSSAFLSFLTLNLFLTLKNTKHLCIITDEKNAQLWTSGDIINTLQTYSEHASTINNLQQHSNVE